MNIPQLAALAHRLTDDLEAQLTDAAPDDRRDVAHAMLLAAMAVNVERHGVAYTGALAGMALKDAADASLALAKAKPAGSA